MHIYMHKYILGGVIDLSNIANSYSKSGGPNLKLFAHLSEGLYMHTYIHAYIYTNINMTFRIYAFISIIHTYIHLHEHIDPNLHISFYHTNIHNMT